MANSSGESRFQVQDLIRYASSLFAAAGCDGDKPSAIATALVEADLLGHTTHGLQLAPSYLRELESGAMRTQGEPEILQDRTCAVTWDGRRLPGVWLASRAVDLAVERAIKHGIAAVVIRNSHHIGCLASFLQTATDRGLMLFLSSSDPSVASVAPYGGRKAVFTPDPMAIGIPTQGDPILIDISASITTNGMSTRLRAEGKRFPGDWVLDADGVPTSDPEVLFANPPGTVLPIGGMDHGHKGYGLALMVEALTQGLGGYGRADAPRQWGASVFVQAIDPAAFGGRAAFQRETEWIAQACRDNPPIPGVQSVRLPGQRGLESKRRALAEGVVLYPGIWEALKPFGEKLKVTPPASI